MPGPEHDKTNKPMPKAAGDDSANGTAQIKAPSYGAGLLDLSGIKETYDAAVNLGKNLWDKILSIHELKEALKTEHRDDPDKSKLSLAALRNTQGLKGNHKTRKYYPDEKMNHFRIDWVRNLQMNLTGEMTKESASFDPNFDQDFLISIFVYQYNKFGKKSATGIIDAKTRKALEDQFDNLKNNPLGDNLEARELIPAGASQAQKFEYYKGIVTKQGGIFHEGVHRVNVLGIRGVQLNSDGSLEQTEGAKNAKEKLDDGKSTNYFNSVGVDWKGDRRAADDLLVSMWIDETGAIQLKEKMGTTEFASTENPEGGPTTVDGQYRYGLGKHNTSNPKHASNVKNATGADKKKKDRGEEEKKAHDLLRPSKDGATYKALVPHDKFELYRAGKGKTLTQKEIDNSIEEIQNQNKQFIGKQGINFHTGTAVGVSSSGCQNLPVDDYIEFMTDLISNKESYDAMNRQELAAFGFNEEDSDEMMSREFLRYTIPYTLIDASKIDAGLTLVKTELKSE